MTHCTYCGSAATDRDHIVPCSYTHGYRTFSGCATTPACRECNGVLSDNVVTTVRDRAAFLLPKLRRRLAKDLRFPQWDPTELADLSPELRRDVLARMARRDIAYARIEHCKQVSEAPT